MSITEALGARKEVTIPQGALRYRERGDGEPVVFVHGLLVNGDLWRNVVPLLSGHARCIAPDWPLGSHELPLHENADRSPPGIARIIVDFLDALGIEQATLVGNDSGGAFCQLVAAAHAERVRALILTDCDAFDNFPPKEFQYLVWLSKLPGATYLVAQSMRFSFLARSPLAFGGLSRRRIDDEIMDSWLRPSRQMGGVRRDARCALQGLSTKYTLEAAEALRKFERPVLIAWAPEDRYFPFDHAERLAGLLPNARLERIEDSSTFVPVDQPERLAQLMRDFIAELPARLPGRSAR